MKQLLQVLAELIIGICMGIVQYVWSFNAARRSAEVTELIDKAGFQGKELMGFLNLSVNNDVTGK